MIDSVGRPVRIQPSLVDFEKTFKMEKNGDDNCIIKVRIPTPLRPLTKGQGHGQGQGQGAGRGKGRVRWRRQRRGDDRGVEQCASGHQRSPVR